MAKRRSTLVTAFTAFGRFAVNPSAVLAGRLHAPHELIQVAYAAVDAFVFNLDPSTFDRALLMGVAGNSSSFRMEIRARNRVDQQADVLGFVPPETFIDPDAPAALPDTLWPAALLHTPPADVVVSDDAGGYLCNYLYFRMLRAFPHKSIGFLHVPPFERVGLDQQLKVVREIVAEIGA